jgi:hypothetical protein
VDLETEPTWTFTNILCAPMEVRERVEHTFDPLTDPHCMTTPHTQGQEINPHSAKTTHGTLVNDPPLVAGSLLTVVDYAHEPVRNRPAKAKKTA